MANVPGNPTSSTTEINNPAGPVEAAARMAIEPDPPAREVYIVSSRYGPEGIFSTPARANAKINTLMGFSAYNKTNPELTVRPYILDSE
jgi:hypothetical protein